jgi:hypothetical protein
MRVSLECLSPGTTSNPGVQKKTLFARYRPSHRDGLPLKTQPFLWPHIQGIEYQMSIVRDVPCLNMHGPERECQMPQSEVGDVLLPLFPHKADAPHSGLRHFCLISLRKAAAANCRRSHADATSSADRQRGTSGPRRYSKARERAADEALRAYSLIPDHKGHNEDSEREPGGRIVTG